MLDCQRMGSLLFTYYVESHPKSIDVKDLQKDILNISIVFILVLLRLLSLTLQKTKRIEEFFEPAVKRKRLNSNDDAEPIGTVAQPQDSQDSPTENDE